MVAKILQNTINIMAVQHCKTLRERLWRVACQERLSEVFDYSIVTELPWQENRLHFLDRVRNLCQQSTGYHYAIMFAV